MLGIHGARPPRTRAVLLIASAAVIASLCVGGSPATAADAQTYPGSRPAWADPSKDIGAPPVDAVFGGQLQLKLRDESGAEALARAVSSPGTTSYRQFVTPAAWISRFAPTKLEFAAVVAYVKAFGLTVTATPKDRLFVNYRGTARQLDAAFSGRLHRFRYEGATVVAPSVSPRLPMSVAASVQAVNLTQLHAVAAPVAARSAVRTPADDGTPVQVDAPCSTYWLQHAVHLPAVDGRTSFPTTNCGYTAEQFRAAYGATGDGAGQTIGEVFWSESSTIVRDTDRLAAHTGTPPITTFRQLFPPAQYAKDECGSSDTVEESIDVEAMHGMAPRAGIVYSAAADCAYGVDAALSVLLDDHLSSVVSNSYLEVGEPPIDQVQAEEHQHLLAAAEGVGLYYSSGDDGDNTDQGVAPTGDYFATSPWVTAVGGTTGEIGRDGRFAVQTGWGNSYSVLVEQDGALTYSPTYPGIYNGGAGGGVSTLFAEPWYQRGVVPPGVSGGRRAEPDIAAEADPNSGQLTGYTEPGEPYVEEPWGGTSLAAPLLATQAVLVQQRTGGTLGFVNPTLYALAGSSAISDVLPVKVDTAGNYPGGTFVLFGGQYTSLSVERGWDSVTGLGATSVGQLTRALAP